MSIKEQVTKEKRMFYAILDSLTIGALVGITANILFDKYWVPIKMSTFLGIVSAIASSLILEMAGFNYDIIILAISTSLVLFLINLTGKIKFTSKTLKAFSKVRFFKKVKEE